MARSVGGSITSSRSIDPCGVTELWRGGSDARATPDRYRDQFLAPRGALAIENQQHEIMHLQIRGYRPIFGYRHLEFSFLGSASGFLGTASVNAHLTRNRDWRTAQRCRNEWLNDITNGPTR